MSIDDFFGPEIDSQAVEPNGVPYPDDGAWTDDNAATKQYDSYKVQAVINWINGYEHSGNGPKVGTPAIYGMNFQVVSTAEKLKSSPAVLIGPNAQGKYTAGPVAARRVRDRGRPAGAGPAAPERARLRQQRPAADGRHDPGRRRGRLDGDHPDRQARPVAAEQQPAAADRRRLRSSPASTPPGPHSIRATRRWSSRRPTTTGCCGGCRTARRRRLTSSRTTCGRIPPRRSTTPARRSPSSTPACGRSSPASSRRSSSASRTPTRTTRTCSGSRRSARSTRPARRSPNTAATTRATGTFRSSSTPRAPSSLARSSNGVETTQVAPTILKLLGLVSALASGRPARGHASPARPRQQGLTAPSSRAAGRLPAAPQPGLQHRRYPGPPAALHWGRLHWAARQTHARAADLVAERLDHLALRAGAEPAALARHTSAAGPVSGLPDGLDGWRFRRSLGPPGPCRRRPA